MAYEIEHARIRQALRLARENLRKCEREFDRHLADEPLVYVDKIGRAERRVAEARARLHEVEHTG